MTSVAIYGSRGYVGGELMRLLHHHPEVDELVVTSESEPGRLVETQHPPLRGSGLVFVSRRDAPAVDTAFLAGPHGSSLELLREGEVRAKAVIDLGADHRLTSSQRMTAYYGWSREESEPAFVPGIAEIFRRQIASSSQVAVPGCMANAAVLMLHPLARAGLLDDVHVDARTGSSGSGASSSGVHDQHPARAGAMRVFAPLGHRHEAELVEQLGIEVTMSATSTPQVRGIQTLARVTLPGMSLREVNDLYQQAYSSEPFVRLLMSPRGPFRYPDPKVLLGSNFCDISVAAGNDDQFLVMAALDNLMKGAAGNAVQSFNLMEGLPEETGLSFPGLHPL